MPTAHSNGTRPRPMLKWAGGKRSSLDVLLRSCPASFPRYFEPFVGGGALFFGLVRAGRLTGAMTHLSDINQELVDTYIAVRDSVDLVISALEIHEYSKEHFYRVRDIDPADLSLPDRAARMIYLNRTGFNGLYRVNRKGKFNVPIGRYVNPVICDAENLRATSAAFESASISRRSFLDVAQDARAGDLVYFDPPYVPLSKTSNFVSYAKAGFCMDSQASLAELFEELDGRGVNVLLSNSDTDWARTRFRKNKILSIKTRRRINSNSERRGLVGEVLVLGNGLESRAPSGRRGETKVRPTTG